MSDRLRSFKPIFDMYSLVFLPSFSILYFFKQLLYLKEKKNGQVDIGLTGFQTT